MGRRTKIIGKTITPQELKKLFIKELEKEKFECFKKCEPSDNSLMFSFDVLDEFEKFMEDNKFLVMPKSFKQKSAQDKNFAKKF